jgi:hypothetical protein
MAIGPTGPGIPLPDDPNAPIDNAAGLAEMLQADQQAERTDQVNREAPDPPEQRARLVKS